MTAEEGFKVTVIFQIDPFRVSTLATVLTKVFIELMLRVYFLRFCDTLPILMKKCLCVYSHPSFASSQEKR